MKKRIEKKRIAREIVEVIASITNNFSVGGEVLTAIEDEIGEIVAREIKKARE